LGASDVFLFARTTSATELDALRGRLGRLPDAGVDVGAILQNLPRGEFLLIRTEEAGPRTRTFVAAPRMTSHVRHFRKYTDGRLPGERCFFFRTPDGRLVATAGSLTEFLHAVQSVGDEVLADHATRGDFSRWLLEVFADRELGRQLAKTEGRWGRDEIRDLRRAIERSVAAAIQRAGGQDPRQRHGR
jgi:hypothetical protein